MRLEEITPEKLETLSTIEIKSLIERAKQVRMKYTNLPYSSTPVEKISSDISMLEGRLNNYKGIYLTPPHGELIWNGYKRLIVKSKRFHITEPLYLISDSVCYCLIKLHQPKSMTNTEFKEREDDHCITEKEKEEWWNGKDLYSYEFNIIERFKKPLKVEVPQGTQTFLTSVKFIKALEWGLGKPANRIFEFDDLKNTPRFKSGKALIECKFDGVRCRINKQGDRVIIFTDPEETKTPDKTKRLPFQIEELSRMKGDFVLDGEIIMVQDDEVLHRTATNALINGKFDPSEQANMANIYDFDILSLSGKNTRSYPLKERKELLSQFTDTDHIHFVRSTSDLSKKSLSYIIDLSMPIKEIIELKDKIMSCMPKNIAEGVMIKLLDAPYEAPHSKSWCKWKQKFESDMLIVDKFEITREGKKTGIFNYLLAVGPIGEYWYNAVLSKDKKAVTTYGDHFYLVTGKSDNTKIDVEIGKILRVASEDVNSYETDNPDFPYYKTYVAVVLQPVPERDHPDKVAVLARLSTMTPPRETIAKSTSEDKVISLKEGKIAKEIYDNYAKDNEPLPDEFYNDPRKGTAFAQTHIRGITQEEYDQYQKDKDLSKLFDGHSIHIDLRMDLGLEKLIQFVITDNDVDSYLRYLVGGSREIAGGKTSPQHSLMSVKQSAEEGKFVKMNLRLNADQNSSGGPAISKEGAKKLAEIQILDGSYLIEPGGVGATINTYSWMGFIWEGKVKTGCQRKEFHEYFLYPDSGLPEVNKKFFDGRFVFKCLKRPEGTARWETWKCTDESKPADPILHKDSGYQYPVKESEIKVFGREGYEYGKKEPR